MATPRYIPKTFEGQRSVFISQFMADLVRPYVSFLTTQLDAVIAQNQAITGAPCYYLGDTMYARHLVIAKIGKYKLGNAATLQPSVAGAHAEWRDHYDEHNNSWQRFSQSLKVILLAAKDWQMLRDMLPDHVLAPYFTNWGFEHLTRTRPDLQTAHLQLLQQFPRDDMPWEPKLTAQYAAISEKIDLYVGYRLL